MTNITLRLYDAADTLRNSPHFNADVLAKLLEEAAEEIGKARTAPPADATPPAEASAPDPAFETFVEKHVNDIQSHLAKRNYVTAYCVSGQILTEIKSRKGEPR